MKKKEGKYSFFTSSLNIDNYVDDPDYNEEMEDQQI
jgi:hypothetical protein